MLMTCPSCKEHELAKVDDVILDIQRSYSDYVVVDVFECYKCGHMIVDADELDLIKEFPQHKFSQELYKAFVERYYVDLGLWAKAHEQDQLKAALDRFQETDDADVIRFRISVSTDDVWIIYIKSSKLFRTRGLTLSRETVTGLIGDWDKQNKK